MSHLRSTPRDDVPVHPSGLFRVGLTALRLIIGLPVLAVWVPYLALSYLLSPKPFASYSFLYHAIRKTRPLIEAIDDWPAPETPEIAWGMRQLDSCRVKMERIEPIPEGLRKGIAICPQIEAVPRAGYWLIPKGLPEEMAKGEKIMMQLHGGGFKIGHPIAVGNKVVPPASYGVENGMRIFSVNYRKCLTPDSAFPAPLLDAVAGYLHLIRKLKIPPEDIMITAESAGSYIAIMLSRYLHLVELPQPARYMLMSPVTDFSFGLGKLDRQLWVQNQEWDLLSPGGISPARNSSMQWYTDETIAGPWCSPASAPPETWAYLKGVEVFMYYGTKEVMTKQIQMWIAAIRAAGANVVEELLVDCNHVALLIDKRAIKQVLEAQQKWIKPWKEGKNI